MWEVYCLSVLITYFSAIMKRQNLLLHSVLVLYKLIVGMTIIVMWFVSLE